MCLLYDIVDLVYVVVGEIDVLDNRDFIVVFVFDDVV